MALLLKKWFLFVSSPRRMRKTIYILSTHLLHCCWLFLIFKLINPQPLASPERDGLLTSWLGNSSVGVPEGTPLDKQNRMQLSYCWSCRSPFELAEFIQIQLSGWTIITQCDNSHPWRTGVEVTDLANWGGLLPLSAEAGPLLRMTPGENRYVMTVTLWCSYSPWKPGSLSNWHEQSL